MKWRAKILNGSFTSWGYNLEEHMLLLVISMFFQVAAAAQSVVVRTFDDDKIGAPPAGFVMAAGRDAAADTWTVRREGNARVLVHEGRPSPPDSFSVAIFPATQFQEVAVSVRLKTTGGARTAGLVWKYQDAMNHYAVQLDLATQDLAMYRVANGNRIRLEREDDLELDPDAWHSLKISLREGYVRVYLGGIRVYSERDRQSGGPTGVGLWVSGDSTVMFDDFRVADERRDSPRSGPPPTPRP